jgi:hypothetical protein
MSVLACKCSSVHGFPPKLRVFYESARCHIAGNIDVACFATLLHCIYVFAGCSACFCRIYNEISTDTSMSLVYRQILEVGNS